MKGTAVFSPCRNYRYVLGRGWGEGCKQLWVMINPSTASAKTNDPTIRNVIKFAQKFGYDGVYVVNLFAIRSPDPSAINIWPDPVGPDNDKWIRWAASRSTSIMLAWGNNGRYYPGRIKEVMELIGHRYGDMWCLGMTGRNQPMHPARLNPKKIEMERYAYIPS